MNHVYDLLEIADSLSKIPDNQLKFIQNLEK